MPAIPLQRLKGFLVSCTSFLAVPLPRLALKIHHCLRHNHILWPVAEVHQLRSGLLTTLAAGARQRWRGAQDGLSKAEWELNSDKWPSKAEVGYIPLLPTNESLPCIKPLLYHSNFFTLLKAPRRRLLTHRMKPDVANWFWIAIAHLKHMLCSSTLGLPARFSSARAVFQIRRKFTLWNLFEVG